MGNQGVFIAAVDREPEAPSRANATAAVEDNASSEDDDSPEYCM
jgi:hypothetical protein